MSAPRSVSPTHSLSVLLDEELVAAAALTDALAAETLALRGNDADELARAVDHKTTCVVQLATTSEARHAACEQLGLRPARERLDGLQGLADAAEVDSLQARWRALMDGAEVLRERNDVNGRIVSRGLESVQALIAAFRGDHAEQALYGRSAFGKSAGATARTRPIAQA